MNLASSQLPFALPKPLRLATSADIAVLSQVYAAAFANDPVRQWLLGRAKAQTWRGRWLSAGVLRIGLSEGYVLTTANRDALLILTPPTARKTSVAGMLQVIYAMGFAARRAIWLKQQMQQQAPAQAHWHIAVLATHPAAQGRGYGRALLQPVLEHARQAGEIVWLESSNPVNDPFYQRLGFQNVGQLKLPNAHSLTLQQA